jgi:hypothetical protein
MTDQIILDELPEIVPMLPAADAIGVTLSELARLCIKGHVPYVELPGAQTDSFQIFHVANCGISRAVVAELSALSRGPSAALVAERARTQRRNATDAGWAVTAPGEGLPPAAA